MSWTVPNPWTALARITKARLDEQIYENMTVLSTHAHTGAAGQGAALTVDSLANRTRNIFVPAANGAVGTGAPTFVSVGTWSSVMKVGVLRDANTDGIAFPPTLLPADWASGTVTVKVVWAAATGGSGNARIAVGVMALSTGDVETVIGGADDVTQTQDLGASANLRTSTFASCALTVAANNFIRVNVSRAGAHANDTCVTDIWILGVLFEYTSDS